MDIPPGAVFCLVLLAQYLQCPPLCLYIAAFVGGLAWLLGGIEKSDSVRKPSEAKGLSVEEGAKAWIKATAGCKTTNDFYLIVGGGGFFGRKLIEALLARGETKVRVFDLAASDSADSSSVFSRPEVEWIQGDMTKPEEVRAACEGVDTVIHCAAIIRFWENLPHQYDLSHRINVGGTQNVIDGCVDAGVKRLIFTSSSNVCIDTENASMEMNEDTPYVTAKSCPTHYGWTKAQAEKLIRAAHGKKTKKKHTLSTAVVRPCSGIFGAGDKLNLELFLSKKEQVFIFPKLILDWVHVENVVLGHLLLESAMQQGTKGVAGEVFCVSNEEPMMIEDFYWTAKALLPVDANMQYVPPRLMKLIAAVVQAIHYIANGCMGQRISLGELDMLTPAMCQLCEINAAFPNVKAKKLLGYRPVFTVDEGLRRSIRDYFNEDKGASRMDVTVGQYQ
jgi:sterol-4alpha-carboxylate 3-dehydrogenase (decarboxylating)